MGLILDTSVVIAGERRRETVSELLTRVQASVGDTEVALSTVSVVELTHGAYRARTDADRKRRLDFCDSLCEALLVHPVTVAIAQIAGRIEGEQAALGVAVAFEDLLIGATALHLGFGVATLNLKHFQLIPGLRAIAS